MKNDGGPAFPVTYQHDTDGGSLSQRWQGLSLRDWIAGQALAGEFASQAGGREGAGLIVGDEASMEAVARRCYLAADAMLKERSRE